MNMNRWNKLGWIGKWTVALLAGLFVVPVAAAEPLVVGPTQGLDGMGNLTITWFIQKPPINAPRYTFGPGSAAQISICPFDLVLITAGGWGSINADNDPGDDDVRLKNYVTGEDWINGKRSPVGYVGTILVPGLTDGLPKSPNLKDMVRLSDFGTNPVQMLSVSPQWLTLGFEDNGYPDNGYRKVALKGLPEAWVALVITRNPKSKPGGFIPPLGGTQAKRPGVLETVVKALNHKTPSARLQAVEMLSYMSIKGYPALAGALKNGDPQVRAYVAQKLGEVGPRAKAMVPHLLAALKDSNRLVHTRAAEALKKIDPAAAKKAGVR
jgi:hypothetical protein